MVFIILMFSHGYASAQETAVIKRDTQLRKSPSDSAPSIAALQAQSTVTRTPERRGAWVQVEANGATGWVHMFDLAAPASADSRTSNSAATSGSNPLTEGLRGLGNIFGGGGKTSTVATSTAGARGLNEGDISSPTSSTATKPQAASATQTVTQVESQRISAAHAQNFAKVAGLQPRNVQSLAAPPPPAPLSKSTPSHSSQNTAPHNNESGSSGFNLMESGN